jgi:hypothetical protein
MRQKAVLAIALTLTALALLVLSYPSHVQSTSHHWKIKPIPQCKGGVNGTKHETEGNATKHVNNCA